ncbi:MAG: GNAT family N-acetyltransferase [Notoacmeibacter sp.]|nr:GNAT family N-acetyltransferase [Notoacmeibacter sp.]
MALGFASFRKRQFVVLPLQSDESAALAALHGEDFVRPWTDGEFAELMKQDTVFGFTAREEGKGAGAPLGFVLSRMAADEGEILTLAVARRYRRLGIGRLLMDAVLRHLYHERAQSLFLEVDEANAAALALYKRLGFKIVGQRPGYYENAGGRRGNAHVMRRDLYAGGPAHR